MTYDIRVTDCCPECGSDDLESKEYNDGRIDRQEVYCCECDWMIEL